MRVLFLSQIVPYPPHGGVLQRGYNLLRELGKHADVHLLAFVHPDELRSDEEVATSNSALGQFCQAVEYFPLWAKQSRAHRFSALTLSAISTQSFSLVAHRSRAFQRRVTDLVRARRFDLVHADTIALDQFLESHRDCVTVLTHHNIESQLMARRAEVETRLAARQFLRRDSAKIRAREIAAAPKYDMNIVVSEADRRTLVDMVPEIRTAVVPNGVDISYFAPDSSRQSRAVIYAGGMNMFANRDAVLYFLRQIWPMISAQVPEVRFFAIGQDPPPELEAISARDRRVIVTGRVADIRPYVLEAAVYVVPLRVGGGTRLKVLDAMAMGKAMVSTSVGCEGIELQAGKHLLIADTPASFAEATVRLLRDADSRLALGRSARALVEERYSWRIIGGHLMDAYRTAIANRQPLRASTVGGLSAQD
jgi:sugar transferase (PEP-CTERM/EpsH1 system associated)